MPRDRASGSLQAVAPGSGARVRAEQAAFPKSEHRRSFLKKGAWPESQQPGSAENHAGYWGR